MAAQQPPVSSVPKELAALGFQDADEKQVYRMLIGSEGLDKTGKSDFWMGAPGPIAGINLDIGLEGVIRKHSKNKKMWIYTENVPPMMHNHNEYKVYWDKVRKAYEAAVNNKDVRTVVVDTGGDMWELMRLAEFGTVTPSNRSGQLAYASANALYRGLIRMVYESDKNLVMTHKLSKKWETQADGSKAFKGQYERDGFGESQFLVQVNVRHLKVDSKFSINIINCRHDPDLDGMDLEGDDCSFKGLGKIVFPGTTDADWK